VSTPPDTNPATPTVEAAPAAFDVGEVTLPPMGAVGLLRWAWRQLTSMRTALLLLLLLAVAAVPGSVFPQRRVNVGQVEQYLADNPDYGPWLDRLGLFDVYSSPWFSAIYLLLFVSLVGCVLPRTRVHLRALRAAPPRTPRRLERLPGHARVVVDRPADDVLDTLAATLRRRRYRVARHDDVSVSAERGYLAETGNLVFHLALLALLVAVAAGSLFGYSGQVLVVEKTSFANSVASYDTFEAGTRVDRGNLAPFAFTLDQLRVRFETQAKGSQFGAPRQFDADVTVRDEPGAAPRQVTISPNQPLDSGGARVFLLGNGYAPVVTVRDGNGDVAWSGPVPFLPTGQANYKSLGVVKVPDAKPRQIGLSGFFLPTYAIDPQEGPVSLFPDAVQPRLALAVFVSKPGEDGMSADGRPTSVYTLDTSRLEQVKDPDPNKGGEPLRLLLAPGTQTVLPDGAGTVSFDGLRRYAALDVRYDPSKGWVLLAAVLALVGVTTSLFVRRRRVWFSVRADAGGRTVVEGAALSRGDDPGLADEVRSVLGAAGMAAPDPGGSDSEPDDHPDSEPRAGRMPVPSGSGGSVPTTSRQDKE
jgi:cytochrome c biogenesis protein